MPDLAKLRMDRAVSTFSELTCFGGAFDPVQFRVAISRSVIAMYTVAEKLDATSEDSKVVKDSADLLWSLGEQLNIITDGSRR